MCVTPEHFSEQVKYLKENYTVISLTDLYTALQNGKVRDRSVVITFDDGYYDNFVYAKPVLERYNVPATFFISSGHIGSDREFWWDDLERYLLCDEFPVSERICLTINGKEQVWNLPVSDLIPASDQKSWNVLMKRNFYTYYNPTERHRLYRTLQFEFKRMLQDQQNKILYDLAKWSNMSLKGRVTHRAMTGDELTQLDQNPLFEIGAHTITHPQLTRLPFDIQKNEISGGKEYLENLLGHPVESFSYPYGEKRDYDRTTALHKISRVETSCYR
jgi:peptidoglycan/xylan/chitin deacetylase (PgdA/CDA1 family)